MQILIKRIKHPTDTTLISTIISLHLGRAIGQVHTLLALRL